MTGTKLKLYIVPSVVFVPHIKVSLFAVLIIKAQQVKFTQTIILCPQFTYFRLAV